MNKQRQVAELRDALHHRCRRPSSKGQKQLGLQTRSKKAKLVHAWRWTDPRVGSLIFGSRVVAFLDLAPAVRLVPVDADHGKSYVHRSFQDPGIDMQVRYCCEHLLTELLHFGAAAAQEATQASPGRPQQQQTPTPIPAIAPGDRPDEVSGELVVLLVDEGYPVAEV
jgi:hypothetical protein